MLNDNGDRSELLERVGRLNQLVKHVQDVLFWWNCPDSEHCRGNSEWKNAIWSDTETIVQRSIELSDYNRKTLLKLRASCFSILNCLFVGHPGMVSMIEVDEATRIVLEVSAKVRKLENETPLSGKPNQSFGLAVPDETSTLTAIPATYRYQENVKGEPLTARFCLDRFGITDAMLSRKGKKHRIKSGRKYCYAWSLIKLLADEKLPEEK